MAVPLAPTSPPLRLDWSRRVDPALLPERMDQLCSYEEFRACVQGIAQTTRLTMAYGPILRCVQQAAMQRRDRSPLHIVDVGSGGGDVLRRIALWARQRRVSVHLTGIDLNPHATRAATEFSAADRRYSRIEWLTGDVFTDPRVQQPDLVLSSLVTHHMRDGEVVEFLRWMEAHARHGWFVSDLRRSRKAYHAFAILARVLRMHPFVRTDGLVSLRRAFREADWLRFLDAASVPAGVTHLHGGGLGRLCLTRLRGEQG